MSLFRRFSFAALAVLSLVSGCSVGDCVRFPTGPHCGMAVGDLGGEFTVTPRRLNIKGDSLSVSLGPKTNSEDAVKLTQPGAMDLDLGKLNTGAISLSGAQLKSAGFRTGKANLTVGLNSPVPVRLYLIADYGNTPVNISTGNNVPLWAGIVANQTLVSLVDARVSAPSVGWGEYSYQSLNQTLTPTLLYSTDARASASLTQKFVGYPNALHRTKSVMLTRCTLGTASCVDRIQTTSSVISELAVNRKGTILGAILDSTLVAYFIETSFGDPTTFLSIGDAGKPTLIGTEDIDDDGLADFVVWDETAKSIRVLRQSLVSGRPAFAVDSGLSSQIQAQLKSDIPQHLFLSDVDGDGYIDVLYSVGNQITLISSQGPAEDGKFRFSRGVSFSVTSGSVDSLFAGDVDVDNLAKVDIAIATKSDKKIQVIVNNATY